MKQSSNRIEKASAKELLALVLANAKAAERASKTAHDKAQLAKAKYKAARKAYKPSTGAAAGNVFWRSSIRFSSSVSQPESNAGIGAAKRIAICLSCWNDWRSCVCCIIIRIPKFIAAFRKLGNFTAAGSGMRIAAKL